MPMSDNPRDAQPERQRTAADLRELIDALDRRTPGLEGESERQVVREAAALKAQALARLDELGW